MGDYEIFDHTADVGFDIRGDTLEDLLETAARATFELMLADRPTEVATRSEVRIRLEPGEEGHEEILVRWLQELLYLFEKHHWVPLEFVFHEKGPQALRVRVGFGEWDPEKHRSGTEVKAVTYHGLEVKEHRGGHWTARVILDI